MILELIIILILSSSIIYTVWKNLFLTDDQINDDASPIPPIPSTQQPTADPIQQQTKPPIPSTQQPTADPIQQQTNDSDDSDDNQGGDGGSSGGVGSVGSAINSMIGGISVFGRTKGNSADDDTNI